MVFAPWRASATAPARPIPRLPPVTQATFPERSNIVRSWVREFRLELGRGRVYHRLRRSEGQTCMQRPEPEVTVSIRSVLLRCVELGKVSCKVTKAVSRSQKLSSFLDAFLVVHRQDAHPLINAFDETRKHFART